MRVPFLNNYIKQKLASMETRRSPASNSQLGSVRLRQITNVQDSPTLQTPLVENGETTFEKLGQTSSNRHRPTSANPSSSSSPPYHRHYPVLARLRTITSYLDLQLRNRNSQQAALSKQRQSLERKGSL